MSIRALQILDTWQSASERCAEAELDKLEDTLDELTTITHHRDGAHIIRANHDRLKTALVRLHDLYLSTMPASEASVA